MKAVLRQFEVQIFQALAHPTRIAIVESRSRSFWFKYACASRNAP